MDPEGELTTVIGGVIGFVGGAIGTIAQGGSASQVIVNAITGGVIGALAGSGIPVVGTPLGSAIMSAVGNLAGQIVTKEPCDDITGVQ